MQLRSQTVIVHMAVPANLLHYQLLVLVKLRLVLKFKTVITGVFLWTDFRLE